jgi:hypothetical protein
MKKYDPKAKKCQDAIRLKYEGEEYAMIAKTIKVPLDTIKGWFEYGGLLYEQYAEYRDKRNEELQEEAKAILQGAVATASKMLVALMGSNRDDIKFKAANAIIERIHGKPTEFINQNSESSGSDNFEKFLAGYEQRKRERGNL